MSRGLTRRVKRLLNPSEWDSDDNGVQPATAGSDSERGRSGRGRGRASSRYLSALDSPGGRSSSAGSSDRVTPTGAWSGTEGSSSSHETTADPGNNGVNTVSNGTVDVGAAAADVPVDASSVPTVVTPSSESSRKLDLEDAESIIGGSTVTSTDSPAEEAENARKEKKVFKFSLPFANPLPTLDIPTTLTSRLSLGQAQPSIEEMAQMDQETEDRLFANVRVQDNSRRRAVRTAIAGKMRSKPVSWPEIDGPVVIMGGYRGSVLRDRRTGRRVWIPLRAGLNIRRVDLSVGIDDADEEQEADVHLYASGMLTHIGPVDISKNLIRQLDALEDVTVYDFGYDWRLSCEFNSKRLATLLKKIKDKFGKPAIVIAHSMGGLIAHHAMQSSPELFRGLLYAGVPSSCPNILGPLRYGDAVLLSSRVLTARVNFLMRSSYVFLPLNGHCFVDAKDPNTRYDLDFFDVNTWIEYNLTPCVSPIMKYRLTQNGPDQTLESTIRAASSTISLLSRGRSPSRERSRERSLVFNEDKKDTELTRRLGKHSSNDQHHAHGRTAGHSSHDHQHYVHHENHQASTHTKHRRHHSQPHRQKQPEDLLPLEDAIAYLDRTLKRTKRFLEELAFKEGVEYPPLAVLYGTTVPTLRASKVNGKEGIKDGDYNNLLFGAGDGVVYKRTLMPEARGFSLAAKVPTDRGHVSLLTDIDGVAQCFRAIIDEENKRKIRSEMSSHPPA